MKKILCIGSVTTDIILSPVEALPLPGALRAVAGTSMHVGGCAANAAIDLARLGASVSLCCRVGTDHFGDFVLAQAAAAGVDTAGVTRGGDVATTSSVVCVNAAGERSFLYFPGSTSAFRSSDVPPALVDACDIVFVAGAMLLTAFDGAPCGALLAEARRKGKLTAMDTAWDFDEKWLPKINDALPGLDIFMPSYDEAARLSQKTAPDDIADFFFEKGVKSVIIKLGRDGAYLCPSRQVRYRLPAYSAIRPVDTTGAGDAFCAGFLFGLARGWDFARSGAFANATATHCIQVLGASGGIPCADEVLRFMAAASPQ